MKSILVVDDDPASLALVEATLGAEGYEIRTAQSSAQALEVLKDFTPDAMLLDIQLHGLDDGLEFARRLKANIATRAMPIVAFTAYADRKTADEAQEAGCDGFLEKPITAAMLAETVRKVLAKA